VPAAGREQLPARVFEPRRRARQHVRRLPLPGDRVVAGERGRAQRDADPARGSPAALEHRVERRQVKQRLVDVEGDPRAIGQRPTMRASGRKAASANQNC
jgi:hypothetical protein